MNAGRIFSIAAFAVLGLIIGYVFFGKWGGEYVSLKTLFSFDGSPLHRAFRVISGIDDMRDKVLVCGAIGVVVGALMPRRQKI